MSESKPGSGTVTVLLEAARQGDQSAMDKCFSLIYDDLRAIARRRMLLRGSIYSATALVNEAWVSLEKRAEDGEKSPFENRNLFFGLAATIIIRILTHEKRKRRPEPLQEGSELVADDPEIQAAEDKWMQELLHTSVQALHEVDQKAYDVITFRYQSGTVVHTFEETAAHCGISLSTARTYHDRGLAYLRNAIERANG